MRKPVEFKSHPHNLTGMIFRAVARQVIDGDTFDALIDLGFNQYTYQTIRVRNLNTPELVGTTGKEHELAIEAKVFLTDLLRRVPEISLITYKDTTTFGRYVADVTVCYTVGKWEDLATLMKTRGYHVERGYVSDITKVKP